MPAEDSGLRHIDEEDLLGKVKNPEGMAEVTCEEGVLSDNDPVGPSCADAARIKRRKVLQYEKVFLGRCP